MDIKSRIASNENALGFIDRNICSDEERNEYKKIYDENGILPNGIVADVEDGYVSFYKINNDKNISEEDKEKYVKYHQAVNLDKITKDIHTIKNCVVFFTVLSVIGLVAGFIIALQ
ncbi:MAG: hypothetical protein IJO91_00010 [Oscillospiraceae bacterium]|nr:hypothetical protein [Oscillospiraceae bacterium]